MNFEDSIAKLEKISLELEKGECSLDEAIALYEQAVKLSNECSEVLKKAKLKIREVSDTVKTED